MRAAVSGSGARSSGVGFQAEESLVRAAERLVDLSPGPDGRRTLLIVDDDPDMVDTCVRILQAIGYDCLTATSGRQALELLSRRPDLILADLRMPEMDGLALLASVRRLAPAVPVVIFSAYGSAATPDLLRKAGAVGYLAKPFGVSELRQAVARALVPPPGPGSGG
jgi:CheY-like chemotaxis protein